MEKYSPSKIEKKWQRYWEKKKIFKTRENQEKKKFYVLDMFPYPSGSGLHVGHPKGYIATDIIARMKMMQDFNVLHPMGWDAFGLPTENYAIKNRVHPAAATEKNIKTFKKQLGLLGFTYDWAREINTTDPQYYKWTQWIFLQMFKRGLAYESFEPINWCPSCQTGLANEDLEDGKCERCGSVVERKPLRQWVLKITDYAECLLNDLDKLPEWEESIKEMQRNWIGRSGGALVRFFVIPTEAKGRVEESIKQGKRDSSTSPATAGFAQNDNNEQTLEVFTTRPDTLFGATHMVLAPEHPLIKSLESRILNFEEVKKYITKAKNKSDLERIKLLEAPPLAEGEAGGPTASRVGQKTGVELKGLKAINPVNQEKLPIFVADYVMMNYGTGAIMAVPAHDERDWEFAKKYKLDIRQVVKSTTDNMQVEDRCFAGEGISINSGFLNNLKTQEAKEKMIAWLEEKKIGRRQVQYKLRDWVFSRQRYWGEPIPLVKCEKCGWVPVPEKYLPLELPKVKNYQPTGTGESPLANIEKWVNTKCPQCGGPAKRETNTMPQWAGSCWYYLRFEDSKNTKALVEKDKEKYWSPVDLYIGGAEHATRHLIYARFWHKFLYDIGAVNYFEPFTKLQHVGLILAEDGRKMSKRWNNVINPDEVVKEYGADALRLYEMFMGPFSQPCAWSTQGVVGMRRFLDRVWKLQEKISSKKLMINNKIQALLHQTIKKVTEDIESMHYNTAIAKMMEFLNEMVKENSFSRSYYQLFINLLSPFAPHICEEIWQKLGKKKSIIFEKWPKYNPDLAKDEIITLAVQVNGKLRDTIEVPADISEEEAKQKVLSSERVIKWLSGKEPKKMIYVKGKLVSVVI